MKTNNAKKNHRSINLRKATKPIALCISTLFILSILVVFSSAPVQAATSSSQVAVSSVTASSYDSTHTPNLAVDGDDTTWNYWGTNAMITSGKLPQWLQLDLGTQTTISQITTHFYDGDTRTYTYYIQASTDGSNWNTIVPTKTGHSTVTDTFNQVTAKYIKITVTGNTANLAAHIVEIRVYQSATQTSTPAPAPAPTSTPTTTYSTSSSQVAVSSVTASSYDSTHTPNLAIDGDDTTWNYWGTNAMITSGKLPQWLQLDLGTQTTISQITTHFYDGDTRTYTYYIQASTDGSNWNTIVPTKTGSSTVTDTFNQVTARYIKITVTGNTANLAAHIVEIRVYQSATQTSTPAPAPAPTSTPTTTYSTSQTTPSSSNVEPLSAFYADMKGAASSYASLDYGTLHNGNPSIRIGPDYVRGSREVDGAWINVRPGDHIVFSAWVKTSYCQSSDMLAGARLGMDFYISSSQGYGIATIDAVGHQAGHPSDAENVAGVARLPWGNDWTLLVWDIYVPTTYYTYVTNGAAGNYGVHSCNPVQISSMVPWFDARSLTDNGYAWLSDTSFYINP